VPIAPGETFERYAVESLIGRGGMGEVYSATDTRLRRKVALKVLRPDKERPDAVARLFREARAAAALSHPNTIAIHDLGEAEDGTFYIVMELVTGQPLLAYVGDARVSLARRIAWLGGVARALAAAHRAGVIHRDVKPSNVMVGEDDLVKVLDFGLAKPTDPVSFRTQIGHVLGTPRYMAPELLSGREADARSDQYSFGITAYELVAGKHPGGVLGATTPEPLSSVAKDAPMDLVALVAKTLATRPEDRYPAMDDVATALDDIRAGRRPRAGGIAAFAATMQVTKDSAGMTASKAADTVRDDGLHDAIVANATDETVSAEGTSPELAARLAAMHRAQAPLRTLLSKEVPSTVLRARTPPRPSDAPPAKTMQSAPPPAGMPIPRTLPEAPSAPPAKASPPWVAIAVALVLALGLGLGVGAFFALKMNANANGPSSAGRAAPSASTTHADEPTQSAAAESNTPLSEVPATASAPIPPTGPRPPPKPAPTPTPTPRAPSTHGAATPHGLGF
jgi:serine/threonine protein kinase